jgi:hypothetical protein
MAQNISLRIDVSKIDKKKLYVGDKGIYLDCVIIMQDSIDKYGHIGMVVEQQSEEEKINNIKSTILGNVKPIVKKELPQEEKDKAVDGLPF